MKSLRVIILGTGTSHGVPMIGCDCQVCTSADPRDKRTRPSIVVQLNDTSILIDTTPELRIQCLACNVTRVDAVLYTHHHADHVTGLDDLRRFNYLKKSSLTCYADAPTAGEIRRMFAYAFEHLPDYPSSKPQLELATIESPFTVEGIPVVPIPLFHGEMPILGFRIGSFAYCTDCSRIPESSFTLLDGVEVLILDALRRRPHATHFNLEQAVEAARRVGARETYFTHIAHDLAHEPTNAELPRGMALGYDGQIIEL